MMEMKAEVVGGPAAGSNRNKPLVSFELEYRIVSRQNMLQVVLLAFNLACAGHPKALGRGLIRFHLVSHKVIK